MLTRLLVALSTFTITVAPVVAGPIGESVIHKESAQLLARFEQLGGRTYFNSELCEKYKVFGVQRGNQVHICLDRHEGDLDELADTVRHEVWHVVQACNGYQPLMYDTNAEIFEAIEHGWDPRAYKRSHWAHEAEAFNAARNYTEKEISGFLTAYCH